jgi:hypothetical protein
MKITNKKLQQSNLRLFKALVLALSLITNNVQAKALDTNGKAELIIDYKKPIAIELSSNFINRINFKNNRISKIIGDQSKLTSVLSSDGSHLFLTSKTAAGNEFDISVLDIHAEVFDLHLIVKETTKPTLVTLAKPKSKEIDANLSKGEANAMIKAMKLGQQDKYYVSVVDREISLLLPSNLKTKQYAQYRYGKLYGACFEIKNISHKNLIAFSDVEVAASFENVIAVSLDNNVLQPLKSTKVFVVFEGEVL